MAGCARFRTPHWKKYGSGPDLWQHEMKILKIWQYEMWPCCFLVYSAGCLSLDGSCHRPVSPWP